MNWIPVATFRAQEGLPPEFGVALFEPKDYSGLGRIDEAGAALNSLREAVLAHTPSRLPPPVWPLALERLQSLFQAELEAINPLIGLRDVEIEFAAAGFGDMCAAYAYAALRPPPKPTFESVYRAWLDESERLSSQVHAYAHKGEQWAVQVLTNRYGRLGLQVSTPRGLHRVRDSALACPAEGFMAGLLREVCGRIQA